MNRKEIIILLLLSAINFIHIMDFMIIMPLGNVFMNAFHIDAQAFSILVSCYSIAAFVSSFMASFFADAFDRKHILIVAFTGFSVGTVLCGFAPNFWTLVTARSLAGFFGGLISAQVLSIIADLFDYERRGRAMSSVMMAFSLASAFGVPAGYYLANAFNWHTPFLVIGFTGIAIIPLLLQFIPSVNSHLKDRMGSRFKPNKVLSSISKDLVQLNALALMALLQLGHFIVVPFLITFLENNVGFTTTETPLFYIVGGVLTFLCSPIIGKWADKYGKEYIFRTCVLGSLPLIFLITNLRPIPFYVVLAITGAWFVFSTGRSIPAQAMISNVVTPQERGGFMSINASLQQLFVGLASLLAGWIVYVKPSGEVVNFNYVGYVSIVLVTSCLLIVKFLLKRIQQIEIKKKLAAESLTEEPTDIPNNIY